VRLHDLRHSCASFLLAAGASPRTVMKTLGHSQIGLTMNTYTHVLPDIERTAVDAAAETIFG
jgi:integrase